MDDLSVFRVTTEGDLRAGLLEGLLAHGSRHPLTGAFNHGPPIIRSSPRLDLYLLLLLLSLWRLRHRDCQESVLERRFDLAGIVRGQACEINAGMNRSGALRGSSS